MTAAAAIQNNTIWLEASNYDVVALNTKLSSHVSELSNALRQGVPACPDSSREGFYDVELPSGWSYIHVHDGARTVYLVAFSPN